jgi:alkylation response protein AidB-like acyl-CoA dehydrogenase
MVEFVKDPQFGEIVDFDFARKALRASYDAMYPTFNMIQSVEKGTELFDDDNSFMVTGGASLLAYSIILAADEHEMAEWAKDYLWTLGWTEEHAGSDLLSNVTTATKINDDPNDKQYHIQGRKWLINNSYHADYHLVVAKIDPKQNGPRSLTLFAVPRSSIKKWDRLETHILQNMVLTKFEIDGPGTLVGKIGHGLTILQRMAMPSKYVCTYVGVRMMVHAVDASLLHLSTKHIFGNEPIRFSNVFRQMYNIVLNRAFYEFMFYRASALSDSSFLQFHGTILKSFLLLRMNELQSQNLLIAGSKGFLKESAIGRNAFDSFVLPVFDGHYTINTLMTAKMIRPYLDATRKENMADRMAFLRENLFISRVGEQMNAKPSDIRHPEFFDYVDYWQQLEVPLDINPATIISSVRGLLNEIDGTPMGSEAEYKYKTGTLLHWMEAIQASAEFWKVYGDDRYLNAIIQTYNGFVKAFNDIVSEGNLETPFLSPIRQLAMPEVEKEEDFLRDLMDIRNKVPQAMR